MQNVGCAGIWSGGGGGGVMRSVSGAVKEQTRGARPVTKDVERIPWREL